MEFFVSFHDIRLFQWIAMIVSASLAVVMLLIKVPHTEHATRLTRAKSLVALSYLFCAFIFGYTLSHHDIEQYGLFSAMTLLINVAFSTATLSFSLINLLGHRYVDFSKLLVSIFAIRRKERVQHSARHQHSHVHVHVHLLYHHIRQMVQAQHHDA